MTRTWPGVVKIKMLHRAGGTVLLPEAVIVGAATNQWAQPQFFYAPQLAFADEWSTATIFFAALDHTRRNHEGLECRLTFRQTERLAALPDRSEVYRCEIETEHSPAALAVGRARVRPDGGIDLRLHHHTARETLPLIHASRDVRASAWNYQGTRKLANVAYAYFTSLRRVETEADLQSIAMASDGRLGFQLDTNAGAHPDLVLDVLREATRNRKATLTLWVPSEAVSTPHIWKHSGRTVHYEVAHPWIYRVALQPGAALDFTGVRATPDRAKLRRFDYAVIGDCTTLAGLEAPFDEENTGETFVVQDLTDTDVFNFWRSNANTTLYAPPVDTQRFTQ